MRDRTRHELYNTETERVETFQYLTPEERAKRNRDLRRHNEPRFWVEALK